MLKGDSAKLNKGSYLLKDLSRLAGRIGILGGSFDPVHLDHMGMAEAAKKFLNLDAIVFLPTPQNPFKGKHFFSNEDRIELLLHAMAGHENFYVSTLEIDQALKGGKDFARTIDTLELINDNKNPKAEIFFILGADCLPELHHWKRFHELFEKAKIVPVQRGEAKETLLSQLKQEGVLTESELKILSDNWVSFNTANPGGEPISSTDIRKHLEKGKIPVDFLPPLVTEYLSDNF